MRTLRCLPYLFTMLFALTAHAYDCGWDIPDDVNKARLVRSPELAELRRCEYSAVMSALILGANGDAQDTCAFHDLGLFRSRQCQTPLGALVRDKVFYEIYPIARADLGDCKGLLPVIESYGSFSRKNVLAQCPGVKPLKNNDDTVLSANAGDVSK